MQFSRGQWVLGNLLIRSTGEDSSEVYELFEAAAESGYVTAQYGLVVLVLKAAAGTPGLEAIPRIPMIVPL